jgi:Family of unknown function (DUF5681)
MRKASDTTSRRNSETSDRNVQRSAVGYGRPPVHTRFKPGKSGNPKGRPKNSRNLRTIIQDALTQKVVLRHGQGKRSITKLEGIVLRQVEGALKGNDKAALAALKMAAQVGLLEAPESEIETVTDFSPSENEMMEELLSSRRITKPKSKPRR